MLSVVLVGLENRSNWFLHVVKDRYIELEHGGRTYIYIYIYDFDEHEATSIYGSFSRHANDN